MRIQDWFLDRFRTVVNVSGNAVGAAVVSHMCKGKLQDPQATTADCTNAGITSGDMDTDDSGHQPPLPTTYRYSRVDILNICARRYAGGLSEVEFGGSKTGSSIELEMEPERTPWPLSRAAKAQPRNGDIGSNALRHRHSTGERKLSGGDGGDDTPTYNETRALFASTLNKNNNRPAPTICMIDEETVFVEI
jgi:hypothetical protein